MTSNAMGAMYFSRLREVDRRAVVHEAEGVALGEHALDLAEQLLGAGDARAADGLVGADDEALEARLGVQHLEHRHRGHGGAVRVRDDALARLADRVRVDLADHERTSGSMRQALELSMTCAPASAKRGRVRAAAGRAGGEERDVDAGGVGGLDILDDHGLARELDGGAGRAGGREQAQLADREGALGEDLAHDGADLAGGADDGDGESGIGDAGH